MKINILLCFLLFTEALFAQEKGVIPISNAESVVQHAESSIRAVVVGISDYQDEDIPDLQFADKDAEAFANYLRSPAGGALDASHLKLLFNAQATTGQFIAALDGLISACKAGDVAIIYFSGHGDVERVTKFQRGYWLTYDSPAAVYAAGAFSLVFLQDIITTLSDAGVQVIVVCDACRAGKLAGSAFGGTQATTAALAQQYANEVKILSCQPDEFSLEGTQWGGGRGCFSYHLVDALYGMADNNHDGVVNLLELGRYLEEKVPAETAPHQQIPNTVGNKATRVATVNTESLAQWQKQKTEGSLAFGKIDAKGMEHVALTGADTSINVLYAAFTSALEQGRLMRTDSTSGPSADDCYKLLIQEPSIAHLHGLMTRNFAAALIDEGQQIINQYLKGDMKAVEKLELRQVSTQQLADQFYRAAALLGEKHYYYPSVKSKGLYFESFAVYNRGLPFKVARALDIQCMRQAVALDPSAAYIWYNLAYLMPADSTELYVEKLEELAPNWPVWLHWAGTQFAESNPIRSINYFKRAIVLHDSWLPPLQGISRPLSQLGQTDEANTYREMVVDLAFQQLEKDSTSLAIFDWDALLRSLINMNRWEEAWWATKKFNAIYPKNQSGWELLGIISTQLGRFDEVEQAYQKSLSFDTLSYFQWENLGNFYIVSQQFNKAEQVILKSIFLDSLAVNAWNNLGVVYLQTQRYAQAEQALKKAIAMDPSFPNPRKHLATVCLRTGQTKAAQDGYAEVLRLDPEYYGGYLGMAYLLTAEHKTTKALDYVEQAIKKDASYWQLYKDPDLADLRTLPSWTAMMEKYFPEQVKH
ncbi:MAG: tetratricopeptide repeat protein [Saprospiraceae bacterium]